MKIFGLELDKSFRNNWIISSIIVFIGSFFIYTIQHSSNFNFQEWLIWNLPASFGGVLFFALIIGITTGGEK